MTQHLLTLIFFIFSFSSSSTTTARDTITPTTPLLDNQTLVSASGSFALGFFNPPYSNNRYIRLWYNKISDPEKVWVANRADPLVNSSDTLSITKDGTLTITNQTLGVVWSVSNSTAKLTNPIAKLLDNGNLVVTESGDESNFAWQGVDHPTNTVIAGMKIGVDLTRGINRTITAWTSYNDPAHGIYHAYMNIKGDPEIYLADDTVFYEELILYSIWVVSIDANQSYRPLCTFISIYLSTGHYAHSLVSDASVPVNDPYYTAGHYAPISPPQPGDVSGLLNNLYLSL